MGIKAIPSHLAHEWIKRVVIPVILSLLVVGCFMKLEMFTCLFTLLVQDWVVLRNMRREGKIPKDW